MNLTKQLLAEFLGTAWLVLGSCGSAVLAAAFLNVGIGLLGVSLAFGLTVVTIAYALGPISGAHLNPAVSVGLWAAGRFNGSSLIPYILAQVAGGVAGAGDVASGVSAGCAISIEESPMLITGAIGLRAAWSASAKRFAASRVRA